MPISRPCPDRTAQGYTLIELLVVLGIMALVSVLLIPRMVTRQDADVPKLMQSLAVARAKAQRDSEPVPVALDAPLRFQPDRDGQELIFFADGSASGGTIWSGERLVVRIRWLDGAIQTVSPDAR